MDDLAPELRVRHLDLLRRQTADQRARAAVRLWRGARMAAEAGVRMREPALSDREVRRKVLALLYGADYAERVRLG